jgi:hypothetical protein
MKSLNLARLNPWVWKRNKRLQQYLETEQHEYMDAIERHRKERDEKERQIDFELFREGREGSNWLENREMRMSAMVLEFQRTLSMAQIDIRKRLGLDCPELLSETELSTLQETMLRSVKTGRQTRRDDYRLRATAAGIPMHRSDQADAAQYGTLKASVRREIRKLSLARSLGRTVEPAGTPLVSKLWNDPVWSKVIAVALVTLLATLFTRLYGFLKQWCWWPASP